MKDDQIPVLEDVATRFSEVLQSPTEQAIHVFLEQNVHLLDFLGWGGFVKSKPRLAESYIPDFMVLGEEPYRNSPRPLITLIETELCR